MYMFIFNHVMLLHKKIRLCFKIQVIWCKVIIISLLFTLHSASPFSCKSTGYAHKPQTVSEEPCAACFNMLQPQSVTTKWVAAQAATAAARCHRRRRHSSLPEITREAAFCSRAYLHQTDEMHGWVCLTGLFFIPPLST